MIEGRAIRQDQSNSPPAQLCSATSYPASPRPLHSTRVPGCEPLSIGTTSTRAFSILQAFSRFLAYTVYIGSTNLFEMAANDYHHPGQNFRRFLSCHPGEQQPPRKPISISLTPSSATLVPNATIMLQATRASEHGSLTRPEEGRRSQ